MTEPPPLLSRRALLGGALVAAAALMPWGARGLGLAGTPTSSVASLAASLRELLDDPGAASRLGRAYLDKLPRWPTLEELVGDVLPSGATIEAMRSRDADALRQGVFERRTEDYREGRIVSCDGWLVSVTEARVAALHVVS